MLSLNGGYIYLLLYNLYTGKVIGFYALHPKFVITIVYYFYSHTKLKVKERVKEREREWENQSHKGRHN